MPIQIPKSLKKVSKEMAAVVIARGYRGIDDFPSSEQKRFENICNHECFYSDADRYINDVYINHKKGN